MEGPKTQFCKHPDSCVKNCIKKSWKALKLGFLIEISLELLKVLISLIRRRNWKSIISLSRNNLRIPLFFSMAVFAHKATFCLMRHFRKRQDRWNSLMAGAAMGFVGTKILQKKHWYTVLTLLAARILDAFYKMAKQRGYVNQKYEKLVIYLMFCFGNMINAYAFFLQPDIIGNEIYRLYEKMADLDPYEKQWNRKALIWRKAELEANGRRFTDDIFQNTIDKLNVPLQ